MNKVCREMFLWKIFQADIFCLFSCIIYHDWQGAQRNVMYAQVMDHLNFYFNIISAVAFSYRRHIKMSVGGDISLQT